MILAPLPDRERQITSFPGNETCAAKTASPIAPNSIIVYILKFKENFSICETEINEKIDFISKTDNELYNLAKEKSLPTATDDIKLCRHIDKQVTTYFSTYFLVVLIASDKISNDMALKLLEGIKENRNWRNNIIYLASKKEIENL